MKTKAYKTVISIILIACGIFALVGGVLGINESKSLSDSTEFDASLAQLAELDASIDKLAAMEDEYVNSPTTVVKKQVKKTKPVKNTSGGSEALYESTKAELEVAMEEYRAAEARLGAVKSEVKAAQDFVAQNESAYRNADAKLGAISSARSQLASANDLSYVLLRIALNRSLSQYGMSLPESLANAMAYLDQQAPAAQSLVSEYNSALDTINSEASRSAEAEQGMKAAQAKVDSLKAAMEQHKGGSSSESTETEFSTVNVVVSSSQIDLDSYDAAVSEVDAALNELRAIGDVTDESGNVKVKGVSERLGSYFDFYMRDVDGTQLTLKGGSVRLNYAKCHDVTNAYREYVKDYLAAYAAESDTGKYFSCAVVAAGALALIAGVFMLLALPATAVFGILALVAAAGAGVYGFVGGVESCLLGKIAMPAIVVVSALYLPAAFGNKPPKPVKTTPKIEVELPKAPVNHGDSDEYAKAVMEYNEALKRYIAARKK